METLDSDVKLSGESLLVELARYTAKAGRTLLNKKSTVEQKEDARTAMGLLTHAQGLVGKEDRSARRLLSIAKRAL